MTEKKRVVRCSICKESGHNMKTCKSKNKNIGINQEKLIWYKDLKMELPTNKKNALLLKERIENDWKILKELSIYVHGFEYHYGVEPECWNNNPEYSIDYEDYEYLYRDYCAQYDDLIECYFLYLKSKFKDNENIQNSDSLGTINYEVIQHQMIHASL